MRFVQKRADLAAWQWMQITKLPSGFFEQSSPRVVS
jgi:hypothetical protein